MSTPLVGQFLVAINGFIKVGNAEEIASYLAIEPPFSQHYNQMIQELRSHYPKGQEQRLEEVSECIERCSRWLVELLTIHGTILCASQRCQ